MTQRRTEEPRDQGVATDAVGETRAHIHAAVASLMGEQQGPVAIELRSVSPNPPAPLAPATDHQWLLHAFEPPAVSASPGTALARRDALDPQTARVTTIADHRFPSGSAQVLAWHVVPQGSSDLSMFLCRGASGEYFLFCRSGIRSHLPADIVPLSAARAESWFDAHPVHFALWDLQSEGA